MKYSIGFHLVVKNLLCMKTQKHKLPLLQCMQFNTSFIDGSTFLTHKLDLIWNATLVILSETDFTWSYKTSDEKVMILQILSLSSNMLFSDV